MKRSLINRSIDGCIRVLEENNFKLPGFAYYSVQEWQEKKEDVQMIRKVMLGWDVTDFGNGNFEEMGGVLFTIRNGNAKDASLGTPYAEKIIVMNPGQRLPVHMHRVKTEDIINRGGGVFKIRLFNSTKDGEVDKRSPVRVLCDGITHTVNAGEELTITQGNSITLTPGMYHTFWCPKESGTVVIGEVSSVNDDQTDNYFAEEVRRFSNLEEDERAQWILCNEYETFLDGAEAGK